MTRIIKGFAVDWGDRWRRTVWAQRDHIYWFNVSPDRQVEFDRSSSPAALTEGDPGNECSEVPRHTSRKGVAEKLEQNGRRR
jgi:hypothetical protein